MSPCLGLVQPKATLGLRTMASNSKIKVFGAVYHHFLGLIIRFYSIVLPESTVQSPMITVS